MLAKATVAANLARFIVLRLTMPTYSRQQATAANIAQLTLPR